MSAFRLSGGTVAPHVLGNNLLDHVSELTGHTAVALQRRPCELILDVGANPGADEDDFGSGREIFLHFHAMKCSIK